MRTVLQVLSPEELDQLHERSLHVLATTGMRVDTAPGTGDPGAKPGRRWTRRRAWCASRAELVEESLRRAPKHFSLGGRRPGWLALAMNAASSRCWPTAAARR